MELERSVETYLRTGSWTGRAEDNPIEIDAGIVYVRHDSVEAVPARDANGGAHLRYRWRGLIVAWERVYSDTEGRDKIRRARAAPIGRFRGK